MSLIFVWTSADLTFTFSDGPKYAQRKSHDHNIGYQKICNFQVLHMRGSYWKMFIGTILELKEIFKWVISGIKNEPENKLQRAEFFHRQPNQYCSEDIQNLDQSESGWWNETNYRQDVTKQVQRRRQKEEKTSNLCNWYF